MKKLVSAMAAVALLGAPAIAAKKTVHISGQGTIADGRVFALNASVDDSGTVRGQATLVNRNSTGDNAHAPFIAHVDISCISKVDGEVIVGGFARTNDANLNDAVFFAVDDSGDRLSYVYFWDGDPETTGYPENCVYIAPGELGSEEIIRGNIKVN